MGYGSSPLARGLLVCEELLDLGVGIIPARAGFTGRFITTEDTEWDHPRSRGVYRGDPSGVRGPTGSSPLARGLLKLSLIHI